MKIIKEYEMFYVIQPILVLHFCAVSNGSQRKIFILINFTDRPLIYIYLRVYFKKKIKQSFNNMRVAKLL